jgi:hypothetical protein
MSYELFIDTCRVLNAVELAVIVWLFNQQFGRLGFTTSKLRGLRKSLTVVFVVLFVGSMYALVTDLVPTPIPPILTVTYGFVIYYLQKKENGNGVVRAE